MNCAADAALRNGQLVCLVFPESSAIIPLISLLAALLAAYMAWQSIENSRDIARRKATLDLIEKMESNDHYRSLVETYHRIMDEGLLPNIVDKSASALLHERGALIDYLNHYELVAISIRHGILDSDMYRLWMQTAFVQTWNEVAPWVQAYRLRQRPGQPPQSYNWKYFEHFQHVALRWSSAAVCLTEATPPLVQTALTDTEKLDRVIKARPKVKQ